VIADERAHNIGHVGEHDRDIRRRAVHDAPHLHAVINQVYRARASGPASALIASRSCSAADRAGSAAAMSRCHGRGAARGS
jgi:hypothetical protein